MQSLFSYSRRVRDGHMTVHGATAEYTVQYTEPVLRYLLTAIYEGRYTTPSANSAPCLNAGNGKRGVVIGR